MIAADVKPPLTNDELLALINVDGFYRFPASIDDYWNLLAEAQYRVDYYDHHVIATMSYESDIHGQLATGFGFVLRSIFTDKKTYLVYNSNRPSMWKRIREPERGYSMLMAWSCRCRVKLTNTAPA